MHEITRLKTIELCFDAWDQRKKLFRHLSTLLGNYSWFFSNRNMLPWKCTILCLNHLGGCYTIWQGCNCYVIVGKLSHLLSTYRGNQDRHREISQLFFCEVAYLMHDVQKKVLRRNSAWSGLNNLWVNKKNADKKSYSDTYRHIHILGLVGVLYGKGWQHCAGAKDRQQCCAHDGGHDATGVVSWEWLRAGWIGWIIPQTTDPCTADTLHSRPIDSLKLSTHTHIYIVILWFSSRCYQYLRFYSLEW